MYTSDDDDAHVRVLVDLFERVDELRAEGVVEGIQHVGPIDGDRGDVVGDIECESIHRCAACFSVP